MHKKSEKKLIDRKVRKIRGIIIKSSHFDRKQGEAVCQMTRIDVLSQIHEPIEVHLVPDVEHGEVLIDPRGNGSLQSPHI